MPDPAQRDHCEQERERLLTVLGGIAEQETARLHSGRSSWPWWLDLAARHGRYGFTNSLLINAQLPTAVDVRSYQEWQSSGRQVRKGETAIRILSLRGNSRPVFDISQTDGAAIAEDGEVPSPEQVWERLRRLAADMGYYVDRGERWTYTGPPERLIDIARDSDLLNAATTLAHQLGHVRLHGGRPDQADEERWSCHGIRRVEADSIAYVVLAHLGLTPVHMVFPAVAAWAGTDPRANPPAAVRSAGDRILHTASWLKKRLDALAIPIQRNTLTVRPTPPMKREPPAETPDAVSTEEIAAIQHTAHQLFISLRPGSWVPAYLAERGFNEDVQTQWQIGYAPGAWRTLTDHLRRLGHSDQAILASGLARRGKSGRLYDLFRDRATMAIRHADGAIVGFIGRLRPDVQGPKYLNSPHTLLFHKGDLLFGLHEVRSRLAAGARPVLVEGPLDAIAVNLAAPDSYAAMAPSGTALTAAQLTELSRVADLSSAGLLLVFDGDQAGRSATERAWKVLGDQTYATDVALLPNGQDPADILRAQGPTALREALEQTKPLADLAITAAIEQAGRSLQTPEDRLAAVRAAATIIAQLPPNKAAHQVARVAHRLQVEHAIVTDALTLAITSNPSRLAGEDFPAPALSSSPPTAHTAAPRSHSRRSTTRRSR